MDAVAEQTAEQATGQSGEQPKPHPKARKHNWKKGQSGNPSGKKGPLKPPIVPVPEGLETREGETQLEAMRWVMSNAKAETIQQWRMQQWLLADQKAFMGAKSSLESAATRSGSGRQLPDSASTGNEAPRTESPSSSIVAVAEDLGTDRVLELAGELIARLAGEV